LLSTWLNSFAVVGGFCGVLASDLAQPFFDLRKRQIDQMRQRLLDLG
jgi:hypothetical protein